MLRLGATEKLVIYILSKKDWIATKEVIELLRNIKRSESAVRATLFRLKKKNLIKDVKRGRETLHTLTDSGRGFVAGYINRLALSEKKWDGRWMLFSFNIPEQKRKLRNILRNELISLGFGRLHANLWISPYNLQAESEKIIDKLKVKEHTAIFITDYVGDNPKTLAFRVWNLAKLSKIYQGLLEKYKKQYTIFKKSSFSSSSQEAMEALCRLLTLKEEIVELGVNDPCLPNELLPDDWKGLELKKVVLNYLQYLYQKCSSVAGFDFTPFQNTRKGGIK